ncbi:hypothetical protein BTVI_82794 [Pitangus sulphuratus]|nr:hypothetical protein BTVI_82794 [Pitangus sulphuratus]
MGLDGIHPRVMRKLVEELTKLLSIIYQQSWLSGEVPDDWKVVNVTLIHKKGCKEDLGNYRPVSLTSVLGKYAFPRVLIFDICYEEFYADEKFDIDCPYLSEKITPAIPAIGGILFFFVMGTLLRTSFSDPGVLPRATPDEAADLERQIGFTLGFSLLRELGFAVSVNFPVNVWEEILLENQHCQYNGLDSSLPSPPEKTEVAFEILPEPI